MKKIITTILLLLCISSAHAETQEEVTQAQEPLIEQEFSDSNFDDTEIVMPENEGDGLLTPEFITIEPTLSAKQRFFNGISEISKDIYHLQIENTNTAAGLLGDKTTIDFENGPIKNLHIWGALHNKLEVSMPENEDNDTTYRVSLINVLFDGKLRNEKESFRLMLDVTPQNDHTFMQHLIQDAFISSNRIPHHRIIVGHSRPEVGYEGGQSPYTLPLLARSQISRHFGAVRKTGVRVQGDYALVDYDFGGYSSDTYFREFMPGAEFDGWVNIKPFGKTDGTYGKLTTGGGISAGERNNTDYFVAGSYLGYEYKKFWTKMEYATSDGSNGATGLSSKRRQGWYATAGYKVTKKLEAVARYDEFDPDKNVSKNNKREYTAGVNYYVKGQSLKLVLNYIYCQAQKQPDSHRLLTGFQLLL